MASLIRSILKAEMISLDFFSAIGFSNNEFKLFNVKEMILSELTERFDSSLIPINKTSNNSPIRIPFGSREEVIVEADLSKIPSKTEEIAEEA